MKITKATRWRVFAGVWIQSLFTSATAFFSLFALPLTTQFGWSSSEFSMAYTIYMFVYCAVGFLGGLLAEKLQPRVAIYLGLAFFAAGWFLTGFASSIPVSYTHLDVYKRQYLHSALLVKQIPNTGQSQSNGRQPYSLS